MKQTRYSILLLLCVLTFVGYDFLGFFVTRLGDPFRDGEARYLMLAAALVGGRYLWYMNPAWAVFWGWSFVRWTLADWPTYGMMDVCLIGGCLLVGDALRQIKGVDVPKLVTGLAVLEMLYVWIQLAGLDPIFHWNEPRWQREAIGTLGHFTLVGPFVALGAVYFFDNVLRVGRYLPWSDEARPAVLKASLCFLACVATVGLSHSTMSALALAAGLGYVFYRRVGAIETYVIGAVTSWAGLLWYSLRPKAEFFGFSGREVVWPYVYRQWLENPIFGNGPGYWAGALPVTNIQGTGSDRWYQAHNDFLQVLTEQGAIGLAIIAVGLVAFFYSVRNKSPVLGGWAALLCVNALGNFTFHVPCFGLLAGYLASAANQEKQCKNS